MASKTIREYFRKAANFIVVFRHARHHPHHHRTCRHRVCLLEIAVTMQRSQNVADDNQQANAARRFVEERRQFDTRALAAICDELPTRDPVRSRAERATAAATTAANAASIAIVLPARATSPAKVFGSCFASMKLAVCCCFVESSNCLPLLGIKTIVASAKIVSSGERSNLNV